MSHTLSTACLAHSANRGLLAADPAIRENYQPYTISSNSSFIAQSQFFRDEQSQTRDVVPSNWTADDNLCGARARPAAYTPPTILRPTPLPLPVLILLHRVALCAHRVRPLSTALDSASLNCCMEPAVAKRVWRGHQVKCAPHLFEPHHHLSGSPQLHH